MPVPSLPPIFPPHVQTVPSDLRTTVPLAPPQMEITSAAGHAETTNPKTSASIVFILRSIRLLLRRLRLPAPSKRAGRYERESSSSCTVIGARRRARLTELLRCERDQRIR